MPPPVPKKTKWAQWASDSDIKEAQRETALQKRLKASWEKCRSYYDDMYELVDVLKEDDAPLELRCSWMERLIEVVKENDYHIYLFIDILTNISNENLSLPKTVQYLVKHLYWEFKRQTYDLPFFDTEEFEDAFNIYIVLKDRSLEKICPNLRELAEDIFLYETNESGYLEYCLKMSMSEINN